MYEVKGNYELGNRHVVEAADIDTSEIEFRPGELIPVPKSIRKDPEQVKAEALAARAAAERAAAEARASQIGHPRDLPKYHPLYGGLVRMLIALLGEHTEVIVYKNHERVCLNVVVVNGLSNEVLYSFEALNEDELACIFSKIIDTHRSNR